MHSSRNTLIVPSLVAERCDDVEDDVARRTPDVADVNRTVAVCPSPEDDVFVALTGCAGPSGAEAANAPPAHAISSPVMTRTAAAIPTRLRTALNIPLLRRRGKCVTNEYLRVLGRTPAESPSARDLRAPCGQATFSRCQAPSDLLPTKGWDPGKNAVTMTDASPRHTSGEN